ncbi:hypothetical protein D6C98_06510 [Aureobasidium pullulans]|nr:hypothetical protein D6C98_06510 [Aureobasidium pullulans]
MSIAPNDAMLNDTLVASAARLHRVRKELLSTPSGIRQPEFGSSSSLRPVAYAALRAQIRREFEEHMERDNRPVTVMTSAGLVTLNFTEVQGNDAWLGEQPVLGLPKRKISQQPHLHDVSLCPFEARVSKSAITPHRHQAIAIEKVYPCTITAVQALEKPKSKCIQYPSVEPTKNRDKDDKDDKDDEDKEAVASPEVLAKLTEVPHKDMKSQPIHEHESTAQG